MPCDTKRLPNQTITERKIEIRETVDALTKALAAGRVKPVVGPQGAVAFQGWLDGERNRVTDGCALRMILAGQSATAKAAIARAELLAGRPVNLKTVAHGAHSHDGGRTWHHHKG